MEIRSNAIEAPDSDFPCMDPMSVDYDYHETYERQEKGQVHGRHAAYTAQVYDARLHRRQHRAAKDGHYQSCSPEFGILAQTFQSNSVYCREHQGHAGGNSHQAVHSPDILKEYRDSQIDKNLLMYDARISRALSGRKNLLSLTVPEWLAAVWRRSSSSEPAIWDDVEVTGRRYFLYKGQDEQCIYLQDAWGEKREYAVTRDSVNLKTDQMEEGKTVLYSQLVKFGRYWWQNGIIVSSEKSSETDEDIADDNGETGKTNAREDFEHFMQASGGKFFVYCRDQEEMADFMLNKMNYKLGNEVNLPEVGPSGALLMASPCTGIHVQVKLLEGVCFPENAAYDQEKAKTEAVLYMVNPTVIPYDLSCVMQDLGMLPDASLNSLEGMEHGRDFVRRNARFLTDYFYHKYRERDFNEEDYRPWLPDGKA